MHKKSNGAELARAAMVKPSNQVEIITLLVSIISHWKKRSIKPNNDLQNYYSHNQKFSSLLMSFQRIAASSGENLK